LEDQHVISVSELNSLFGKRQSVNLIDVREPTEYALCHLDGSVLIPMGELPRRISELDVHAEYVVYCHTGQRSALAVEYLKRRGVVKARSLQGGIDAWAELVDPSMARY